MYINNSPTAITATVTDHIATFASQNFGSTDTIRVVGATTEDTFTFGS